MRVFGGKRNALTFACRDIQSKILQRIYNRATAEEQKWIVRIVLKGMSFFSMTFVSNNGFRHGHIRQGDDCVVCVSPRRRRFI